MKIELGDKVECIHTGFKGVAVARLEFINGCVQYEIVPKMTNKDGNYPNGVALDQNSLKIISKKNKPKKKRTSGGPPTIFLRRANRRNY